MKNQVYAERKNPKSGTYTGARRNAADDFGIFENAMNVNSGGNIARTK